MDKIGLFYGTYTGITGMIAEKIADNRNDCRKNSR